MGDQRNGGISWTEHTWNCIRGCSRVSEGCRLCYAERQAARMSGPGEAYEGLVKLTKSGPRWTGKVRMVEEHLTDPLRWTRPRMVFCNSMSDMFHEQLSGEQVARVFAVMALAPRHTFQILTKRAERMREMLTDPAFEFEVTKQAVEIRFDFNRATIRRRDSILSDERAWPLLNVWLGISAEDQATADERIPPLLDTPAAVRFVSYEPALGPVDFTRFPLGQQHRVYPSAQAYRPPGIDWIIAGAESGPGARPAQADWFRSVRDACQRMNCAYFLKQFADDQGHKIKHPKLDGREWAEYPG